MHITWYGHASFKIVTKDNFVIYIDPFAGGEQEYEQKADLILISHEGYHHLSYEIIRKIRGDHTKIFTTQQVAYEVTGTTIKEGEEKDLGSVKLKAVHAYSMRTGIGKEKGTSLGFLLIIENKMVYFAGSTDLIPEMKEIKCDIALLPVSPTRTMSPQHAVQAINITKPKLAIPMHYGLHGGTVEDAEMFKEEAERETEATIWILEEGKTYEI